MARFPNGTVEFIQMTPTFLAENNLDSGDLDEDGNVDGADLAILCSEFGRTDCKVDCRGDLNNDGNVDESDLSDFATNFGRE